MELWNDYIGRFWPTEGRTTTMGTCLGVQPERLPQQALPWLLPVPQLEPPGATTKAVPLRPPGACSCTTTWSMALLLKHHLLHHHHNQHEHNLLLDHHSIDQHYNPARQRPQPQQAGAVLPQILFVLQRADMDTDNIDDYDCYNHGDQCTTASCQWGQEGATTTARAYVWPCSTTT